MPSGILCMAIAIAMLMPNVGSWRLLTNVAMPSGKLCMVIARAENNPILIKSFLFISGSCISSTLTA